VVDPDSVPVVDPVEAVEEGSEEALVLVMDSVDSVLLEAEVEEVDLAVEEVGVAVTSELMVNRSE